MAIKVELHPKMRVEAGEAILMRFELRVREFRARERLSISAGDFDEIAFACFQFATNLAAGLPKSP